MTALALVVFQLGYSVDSPFPFPIAQRLDRSTSSSIRLFLNLRNELVEKVHDCQKISMSHFYSLYDSKFWRVVIPRRRRLIRQNANDGRRRLLRDPHCVLLYACSR